MATRSRTRLDPDERRNQILDAATESFRSQGYSGVSVDAVATRVGVTRGLVHHYFGSKRGLFLAVVERAVRFPDDVDIVPPGTSGDLAAIVPVCVAGWMRAVEAAGGLWPGAGGSNGFTDTDLDDVLTDARDALVDRMVEELPFPPSLDREMLRSALRCYAAVARVATDEWLVAGTLSASQTAALLESLLLALADSVVPAMGEAG